MKSKKGISLIVLVITIIVIIILAAAVILNLTKNNPMNNAKIDNVANNKDALESSVALYLAKSHAKTQGTFTSRQLILGRGADRYSTEPLLRKGTEEYRIAFAATDGEEGSTTYTAVSGQDVPDSEVVQAEGYTTATFTPYGANEAITVVKLETTADDTDNKAAKVMDMTNLPTSSADSAAWFVDPTNGKVYLVFKDTGVVPQWMTADGSTDYTKIEDPTLLAFVGQSAWTTAVTAETLGEKESNVAPTP